MMRENPQFLLLCVVIGLHFLAAFIANGLSYRQLASIRLHLQPHEWEENGEIYQRLFAVRSWKDHVPTAGPFDKSRLKSVEGDYLSIFILETVRAELAHMLCLAFTYLALFFFTQPYSFAFPLFFTLINLPCIMIQRYNRPRLEMLLRRRGGPLLIPEAEPVHRFRLFARH